MNIRATEFAAVTLLREMADSIESGELLVRAISTGAEYSTDPYAQTGTRLEVVTYKSDKKSDC